MPFVEATKSNWDCQSVGKFNAKEDEDLEMHTKVLKLTGAGDPKEELKLDPNASSILFYDLKADAAKEFDSTTYKSSELFKPNEYIADEQAQADCGWQFPARNFSKQ